MQFRDRIIVRLADPATRAAVFDEAALNQILDAGYDTTVTPVNGPFSAVFDVFRLGYAEPGATRGEGRLYGITGELGHLALTLTDWQPNLGPRADAFWRGAVIARSAPEESVIQALAPRWTDLPAIDAAVAAANGGALPTDPAALEAARRTALADLLKQEMQSPGTVTDARLARLLESMNVADAGALLAGGNARPAVLGIQFSPAAGLPPAPRRYPIAAALLVRDQAAGVADLLLETKLLRSRMQESGVEGPRPRELPQRQSLLVIWVLPIEVFDDDDWPGATAGMNPAARRAARRQRAGEWLTREGIGLAVVAD